jgi:hypothetical protein
MIDIFVRGGGLSAPPLTNGEVESQINMTPSCLFHDNKSNAWFISIVTAGSLLLIVVIDM